MCIFDVESGTVEYAIEKTASEWKKQLTSLQYYVLREAGTERSFTSSLNENKKNGLYVCAACETPLYNSDHKFDSGTGWPSFSNSLPGAFKTKTDYSHGVERVEYHCAKCGAHHGHVFNDGPEITGKRFCNNGLCLIFKPDNN